jgi:hypothetical protein
MIPLIIKPGINIYDSRDETAYHYPTIVEFRNQFPNLDLVNYSSATTPLYHILLTITSFFVGSDVISLRFASLTLSLCLLLLVYRYFSKRGEMKKGLFFASILLFSPYFIGPSIRLSTDNMALLLAILSIYAIEISSFSFKDSLFSNILILLTILTRQIYIWLIGVFLIFSLFRFDSKQGIAKLIKYNLPVIIPISGISFFLFLWKGLTPPFFMEAHTSLKLNWDAPIYAISLLGLYGSFFFMWFLQLYKFDNNRLIIFLLISFGVGILLLHPVSNEYDVSIRGGALWLVASHLPNIFSTSTVFWILFPLGLIILFFLFQYLVSRQEYLMIICFSLWLAANIINSRTYQKYYEPFTFFFIGYTLMPVIKSNWLKWIGPFGLAAGLILIMILRFF